MAAQTACGLPAVDPFEGEAAPAACGPDAGWGTPLITIHDMAKHPNFTCDPGPGADPLVDQFIVVLSDMIRNRYGDDLGVCLDTRCFPLRGCRADIKPAIRVDTVELGSCQCGSCAIDFTEVPIEEVLVDSPTGDYPWTSLKLCSGCSCGAGTVRVTGVWGNNYPLPRSITGLMVVATVSAVDAIRLGRTIISTSEDGTTTIEGSIQTKVLKMLPNNLRRIRGRAL